MLVQAIHHFLPGCRSQGFGIARRHGFKRGMLGVEIPRQHHGVIGTFVVVGGAGDVVEAVNAVGADVVLATKVWGAAGAQFVVAEHVQGAMGLVPRVPCGQGACPARAGIYLGGIAAASGGRGNATSRSGDLSRPLAGSSRGLRGVVWGGIAEVGKALGGWACGLGWGRVVAVAIGIVA